jgi:hypothetical protein
MRQRRGRDEKIGAIQKKTIPGSVAKASRKRVAISV